MGTEDTFVDIIRQFAEERLKNHQEELNTQYQNLRPESKQFREQAKEVHQLIYEQEIQEKIDSLDTADNPWLYKELQEMKKTYVFKLRDINRANDLHA